MMEPGSYMGMDLDFRSEPIVQPNIKTGVGRMKHRRGRWLDKQPDLKKKAHRKMVKKSRRANRR